MAHLASISAGTFSDLSFSIDTLPGTVPSNATGWQALFATEVAVGAAGTASAGEFRRIKNVREFPSLGTPANIVNVPVYGQKTSSQVQGQADAPTIEITLNYYPTEWQNAATYLGELVGKTTQYAFRFSLMGEAPTATGATQYASTVGGLGTVPNSQWYFIGRIEALLINPQLTDATTATLTLSTQTDFFGSYTI